MKAREYVGAYVVGTSSEAVYVNGGRLGKEDGARDRHSVLEGGDRDVVDRRPQAFESPGSLQHCFLYLRVQQVEKVLLGDADAQSGHALFQAGGVVFDGPPARRAVLGIVSGDDVEDEGGVPDRPGHRAYRIERVG